MTFEIEYAQILGNKDCKFPIIGGIYKWIAETNNDIEYHYMAIRSENEKRL